MGVVYRDGSDVDDIGPWKSASQTGLEAFLAGGPRRSAARLPAFFESTASKWAVLERVMGMRRSDEGVLESVLVAGVDDGKQPAAGVGCVMGPFRLPC